MSENTTHNYSLMGFPEALSLIFVIAKLTGYVNWSWFIVFLPVIIHIVIAIILIILALIYVWYKY